MASHHGIYAHLAAVVARGKWDKREYMELWMRPLQKEVIARDTRR